MGCCCCKPPSIDVLREDPNVIDCIKATSFGRATLNVNRPWITSSIINNCGGGTVYYTKDYLGYQCCCSVNAQYQLHDISKVEFIRAEGIILYHRNAIFLHTGTGVKITIQQSNDYYTVVALGSPDAEQFASKLLHHLELMAGSSKQPPTETVSEYAPPS